MDSNFGTTDRVFVPGSPEWNPNRGSEIGRVNRDSGAEERAGHDLAEERTGHDSAEGRAGHDSAEERAGHDSAEERAGHDSADRSRDDNLSEENDEKEKRKPLGKWAKKGIAIGLAALLLAAIATAKETTHDTIVIPSDYTSSEEVSDILLVAIDGKYVSYTGSVIEDPGKRIHNLRDLGIGEKNGTYDGIRDYFENSTDDSRVAEEERILEISNEFQEQQRIIAYNERILKSPKASDIEKRQALEKIRDAKVEIIRIYTSNQGLHDEYADKAIQAYMFKPDERTEHDVEMVRSEKQEYRLSISNLELDISSLNHSLSAIDNPEQLYERDNKPAPKGTDEKSYIFNFHIFGRDIHLFEIKETEVTDLNYDSNMRLERSNPITSETINIDATAIQETKTTRKGIWAILDAIGRMLSGKETGDISMLGIPLHDDPHIK